MINTLKYAQRLEAAGFSRSQAEAQALVIQDALDDFRLMVPVLITLLIPAIQSIYLQLHAN